MKTLSVIAALAIPPLSTSAQTPPIASERPQVMLESQILVEKTVTDATGKRVTKYAPADTAIPGDILVYKLLYSNPAAQPAADFNVKYPVPQGLVFVGTDTPQASVSVDGGNNFGALSALTVNEAGITRPARPGDVTHIRYVITDPVPPGAKGELSFRGRAKKRQE